MFFYRNALLIALCAQTATAFTLPGNTVANTPSSSATTALDSSRYYGDDDVSMRSSSGARQLRRTSSPLARAPMRYPDENSSALARPGSRNMDRPRGRGYRDMLATENIQGGALKTWSFPDPNVDSVQVFMKTEGTPLTANVELWHGPDSTPHKMAVYLEDGDFRPFSAVIATPRFNANSVSIRNTQTLEYPIEAAVEPDYESLEDITRNIGEDIPKVMQGGAIHTVPFPPSVASVAVLLRTDGRPLNARLELLQGPNNNKQVVEVYTEDGIEHPFFAVIETPGIGNVVRIVNTGTVEFPITAVVEPYTVERGGMYRDSRRGRVGRYGDMDGGDYTYGGNRRNEVYSGYR
ncbi:hypothetical protein FRACYDRAFT_260383 [Fragilariopsis cylindrus CCMP1102]|uniref:Uncharacterized protein n=1 Tax=Fragilariopsis cylindrus CCMP1102 TaxID=635003 RepID=A0A1E7FJR6_9STRA|nr:hypothetical protein FRACYDRAFT_260383 [Fragilariopsis cylindrus CCMP1102]|eukprot:OEU18421.1 hypothetical protein FRACYDRAFT_260383 [Fragilariopsis cylindrus CCMP1102]